MSEQLTLNLAPQPLTSERLKGADASAPPPALARPSPARWVASYAAVRGGHYFRFYWMEEVFIRGERVLVTRHLHIRGGNTQNEAAIANKTAIEAAIARGDSVNQIRALIGSQGRKVGNFKKVTIEESDGTTKTTAGELAAGGSGAGVGVVAPAGNCRGDQ